MITYFDMSLSTVYEIQVAQAREGINNACASFVLLTLLSAKL